jgi:hypothetical protein
MTEAKIIVKILELLKSLPNQRARRRVMAYLNDCDLFETQTEPPNKPELPGTV